MKSITPFLRALPLKSTLTGFLLLCTYSWSLAQNCDKIPPEITNCNDTTIKCYNSTTPGSTLLPYPIANNNCDGTRLTYNDESRYFTCNGPYSEIITRTWTAFDNSQNKSTCTQIIKVERATLADIQKPLDYDNTTDNSPMFSRSDQFKKLKNGAPHPDVAGRPTSRACNTINQHYSDTEFPLHGIAKKYARRWVVTDWCRGEERIYNQIIKIADTERIVSLDNPSDTLYTTTDRADMAGNKSTTP